MIPGRLAIWSQPIDAFICKSFKDELKMRYTKYSMEQKDTKARVNQQDMINWVGEFWYDDKLKSEKVSK